jgi:Sulfatase-modifying factor enzyme 1
LDWNRQGYRLPTEAEWEYACRANASTPTRFSFGDNAVELGLYGWFPGNSEQRTHPVSQKRPNGFGLFDMHGNVFEWCWDWFGEGYYYQSPADDPTGPAGASYRVIRGANCSSELRCARSAARHRCVPGDRGYGVGFRLARDASPGNGSVASGTGGGNVDPSRYSDVQLIASCSGERGESFNGGWFSVAGPNSTIKPPLPPGPFAMSSGGYLGTAAHVNGSRALGGWAKLGINMRPGTGLFDASGYHGISFYAKADKPMEIQVMLAQENNDPSYGLCAALKTCYNYPRRAVAVGTTWSRFVVPFDALLSAPLAGGGRVPVTPATIKHFAFVMPVGAFDFWVDEIYFVRRE